MSGLKTPKGERVCVGYYNQGGELIFILTVKGGLSDWFYLYEKDGEAFKKLGKGHSPPELEKKFGVVEAMNGGGGKPCRRKKSVVE